jgi:hypothetical protein
MEVSIDNMVTDSNCYYEVTAKKPVCTRFAGWRSRYGTENAKESKPDTPCTMPVDGVHAGDRRGLGPERHLVFESGTEAVQRASG